MTTEQHTPSEQHPEEQAQQAASEPSEEQNSRSDENRSDSTQVQSRDEEPMVPERVLREREKENKKLRDQIKATDREKQQREDAEKTEIERLSTTNEELQSSNSDLQHRLRRFYFNERINVPNSRWAWAAAQDAGIEIEFDDEHNPTNLDEVRKALRKADPNLFGTAGKADAGEKSQEAVAQPGQAGFLSDLLFNQR